MTLQFSILGVLIIILGLINPIYDIYNPILYNNCIFYDGYHLSKIFTLNDTIMTTNPTVLIGVICRATFYGMYANRLVIKIRDAYL